MILAWRSYKLLCHLDEESVAYTTEELATLTEEENSRALGEVSEYGVMRTPKDRCLNSFSHRKFWVWRLSKREKGRICSYAVAHGYINQQGSADFWSKATLTVNDDIGIRLLTDKLLGIPYGAYAECVQPYGVFTGATVVAVIAFLWPGIKSLATELLKRVH